MTTDWKRVREAITLKIVSANVPESFVDAIKLLVGEGKIYHSRSELIRVALREYILREMGLFKNILKQIKNIDDPNIVKVIIDKEMKTYKVIKRLEL